MVRMNKKGIARILEATIAILIIAGVVLTLAANKKVSSQQDLSTLLPPYLEEIAKNMQLREQIIFTNISNETQVNATEVAMENFIKQRIINPNYNFKIKICAINDVCGLTQYPKNINGDLYAADRVVSATLESMDSKKIKIYLWRIS